MDVVYVKMCSCEINALFLNVIKIFTRFTSTSAERASSEKVIFVWQTDYTDNDQHFALHLFISWKIHFETCEIFIFANICTRPMCVGSALMSEQNGQTRDFESIKAFLNVVLGQGDGWMWCENKNILLYAFLWSSTQFTYIFQHILAIVCDVDTRTKRRADEVDIWGWWWCSTKVKTNILSTYNKHAILSPVFYVCC